MKTKAVTFIMRKNVTCMLQINPLTEVLRHNRILSNSELPCLFVGLCCSPPCIPCETQLTVGNAQHPGELEKLGRDLNSLALTMDTLKCLT